MIKRGVLFALLAGLPVLPGCFSNQVALEPEARSVTLVREAERPLHCKFLGKVNGSSRSSDENSARSGAENDLRNQTAAMKGNFALAESEQSSHVGTSSQRDYFIGGKALLCQTEAMEEANEQAEAKAKAAKDKEDTEREQKEADEKREAKAKKKAKK